MISVCIPTYNRKEYLKQAVESVFRQTCKDYEVIVLDDGSTDGTETLIESLHLPIRYYRQDNKGTPQPYNRLAELARGDYICFLDSDDIFLDDALERLIKAANGSTEHIAYGSYIRIDENGKEIGQDMKKLYAGDITEKLFEKIFVHCVSTLFPRKMFLENGGYDESFKVCFDYDLALRLSLACKYFPAEGPTFKRRRHASNLSGYNYRNHMMELKVLEEFYFSKGGDQKIPRATAFRRLAQQTCRAGKCAVQEKMYPQSREILKKSLAYRFSFKAAWLLLRAGLQR